MNYSETRENLALNHWPDLREIDGSNGVAAAPSNG
jgi:hypothetical protein